MEVLEVLKGEIKKAAQHYEDDLDLEKYTNAIILCTSKYWKEQSTIMLQESLNKVLKD